MTNYLLRIKDKKSFVWILLLVYLYRLMLDLVYIKGIYPYYAYLYNFKLSYSIDRIFYTYLITFVFGTVVYFYINKSTLSSLFILTLTLIYFIPGISIYCWDGLELGYFIYYFCCFILLVFADKVIPYFSLRRVKMYPPDFPKMLSLVIGGLNAVLVVVFIGFSIRIDFDSIYSMREDWASQDLPAVVGYFQPFAARVIPVLIVYFACRKKLVFVFLLVISQLLSFSFGGLKYTFFALVIGLLIGFLYNNTKRITILYSILLLNVFSVFELYVLKRESIFVTIFTRRLSYIPNKISYYYYEFFNKNELLYLRESFMRWFGFSNPYNKRIPALIGDYAFGVKMGANTGMFGEAFSQFGYLSMFIYPFLYILAFRLLESVFYVRNLFDYKVAFTAIILYTISFIDGAFFSILLTQGFLFFCLIMYLLSKVRNENITHK